LLLERGKVRGGALIGDGPGAGEPLREGRDIAQSRTMPNAAAVPRATESLEAAIG